MELNIFKHFASSIQSRAQQLIDDVNNLFYMDYQDLSGSFIQNINDCKTSTYNILMDFIIKYQSDQVFNYSELESFNHDKKKSDAFEIRFNTSKSITNSTQQPMIFSINKSEGSSLSNEQNYYNQIFSGDELNFALPPGLPSKAIKDLKIDASPSSQQSVPRTPTRVKNALSSPKSPFQKFLTERLNNDKPSDSPKYGILEYDDNCELSSISSIVEEDNNSKYLQQRQYLRPEIDYKQKMQLELRLEKAEQTKQTQIQKVQQQAQTVSKKVDILKKKREEHQETLRIQIQQKSESSERRRQEYLQSKLSQNKSFHDIQKQTIIIWHPQFNVTSDYVQHSFIQSIKIIQNGVNKDSIIFNLCQNIINFQTETIEYQQLLFMQSLKEEKEQAIISQQLSQLSILSTLYALFYNNDIMPNERRVIPINCYERVIVFDDNPINQLSKSVFFIPGLINEPTYLKILMNAFTQMEYSVSHFNNFNMFLEFCLSPKINSLVTIDQLILCLIKILEYPILPDDKIIKICLQLQQQQNGNQNTVLNQCQEYCYVFDKFSSISSVLDILQIFFNFPNAVQYFQKEQIFILFSSIISQIAQILLSPQSYTHSYQKFDLTNKEISCLFLEVQSILIQLTQLLVTLLKQEHLTFDYFNEEKLHQEYLTTTKLELISVLNMILSPGILFSEKDCMNYHQLEFSVRSEQVSQNLIIVEQNGFFEYQSMLPCKIKGTEFETKATSYYQNGVYLALDLFKSLLKFESIITYKELCVIFENVKEHLPLEIFLYKKTAQLFNELSQAMLLPVDLNQGLLESN